MADSFIAIDEPAVIDKKLDTEQLTVGVNTVERERVQIAGAAATAIAGCDAANGLDVDVTRVTGNVTVVQSTATNLKVDASGVAVPVTDNAGSLTVDFSGQQTQDYDTGVGTQTQLVAGIVVPASGGGVAITGDAANGFDVDVTRVQGTVTVSGTVTANQGTPTNWAVNVAQINGVAPLMGAGNTGTGSHRVTIASDQAVIPVGGNVAHDGVDTGNPVKIGGFAQLNERAAVADGDRVDGWFDQIGRQVCIIGHSNPEPPVTANGSAAGVTVIAAPGVGVSLYICKGSLHNSAAAEAVTSLRDGAAGTIRFTANLAADGGGTIFDFGSRGWKLTANTALVMDAVSATQYCNVTEYYIAA